MANLEKLLAEQQKLRNKQDSVNRQIKKAIKEEQNQRYCDAGRDLEMHFNSDPTLENIHLLMSICKKYFTSNQPPSITEPSTVSVTKEKRGGK